MYELTLSISNRCLGFSAGGMFNINKRQGLMDIQELKLKKRGTFYYEISGTKIAELSYSKAGKDQIILDHTDVKKEYRGKGFGKALIYFSVEFSRRHNLRIIPACPYAQSMFRRYKELRDVLHQN